MYSYLAQKKHISYFHLHYKICILVHYHLSEEFLNYHHSICGE